MGARSSTRRFIGGALSLLCLTELFALMVLAAVPALHHHLHPDANNSDHECAVTLFATGKLDAASAPPATLPPSSFVVTVALQPVSVFVSVDYQLLPGRAPPACRA